MRGVGVPTESEDSHFLDTPSSVVLQTAQRQWSCTFYEAIKQRGHMRDSNEYRLIVVPVCRLPRKQTLAGLHLIIEKVTPGKAYGLRRSSATVQGF
jgi:hypothetical protein